jgi:hypothetical protein
MSVLFGKWRRNRLGFIADGVVDVAAYLTSSPKLLFVLKEVNERAGGARDRRQFLLGGGRVQTWNNVTR